jgi:signal transduction histidine kinase
MGESRVEKVSLDELKRYFELINASGQRLMSLLNDLLDCAKLEFAQMSFSFALHDLRGVLLDVVHAQAGVLQAKNITVIVPKMGQMVQMDAMRMSQVFSNLLSNAIRYTPAGETIEIVFEPLNNSTLCVWMMDVGNGIADDELEMVFDKFAQSRKMPKEPGGTGLGLAICKEIIEAHHGKIWAEHHQLAEQKKGAIFKFTLPIHAEKARLDTKHKAMLEGSNVTH